MTQGQAGIPTIPDRYDRFKIKLFKKLLLKH